MKEVNVNVLDTPYTVQLGNRFELSPLPKEFNGSVGIYSKLVKIFHGAENDSERPFEIDNRSKEVIAHEIFHAFINEAGIDLDEKVEEQIANFYSKNWRKMTNTILNLFELLDLES